MFTRTPPPPATTDRRRGLTYVIGAIVAFYLALTAIGTLWTDYLWFDSMGFGAVWTKRWVVGLGLGAAGAIVSFLVFWATLILADRLGPRFPLLDMAEEEEHVARFGQWIEGRRGLVRVLVAAGLALFVGLAVATWRDEIFLFLARNDFGVVEPIFNLDVGFYIFHYPLIATALRWLFNLVAVATVVAALAHYLNGGVRLRRNALPTVTHSAKVHVSVMLAVLALIRAAMYRMDALALVFSNRQAPSFYGPGFTDVTARLPALRLLMAIAVVAAIVFIANIWRRGWTLLVVSVGAWVLVSVAASLVYPAIVDRLQVQPQPLARESEYIAHNVEFTRIAYGLDHVEVREFPASRVLAPDDIEANRPVVDNLRLWDASVLPRTYENLQVIRPYYGLDQVDTDRYIVDGEPIQTMVAVRELDEQNLPRADWQNTRLIYTHGLGAVVSQANAVASDGQPQFLLDDLPPRASDERFELEQPRVYFGESYAPGRPVIVKTGSAPQEVDMPVGGEGIQSSEYDGEAGVGVGSLWQRVAFAFRYRDLNLLISGQMRSDSRVLVERNIRAMVNEVAPFLAVDSDPYPVITEGRIVWVVDTYTVSRYFPYSQPITNNYRQRLARSTMLQPGLNYVTNSVKVTIDAYDGTMTFYMVDSSDPVAAAWQETYPDLFRPGSEMPDELGQHLRYPQDIFRVQGDLWLEYHVDEPGEFFTGNDAWSIPPDPATIRRGEIPSIELLVGDQAPLAAGSAIQYWASILPYYLLTRLPGDEDLSYVLFQPFNPRDKPNMSSFLVADAPGPEGPGQLIDFRMPQGTLVSGAGQVGERIQQDDRIAEQFTLWGQQGSRVIRGELLVVPIEDSVMYIQPVYLQSEAVGGFPEFRRVIVVFDDRIEWANTLDQAMSAVFGVEVRDPVEPPPTDDPTDPVPDPEVPGTVMELLERASELLEQANDALREGDLGRYQQLVEDAGALIEEARQAGASGIEAFLR